jgi:hypothetical protein
MISNRHFNLFLALCTALVATPLVRAQGGLPTLFGIQKGLNYVQTSAAAPALHPQPARFETVGENVTGSLRLPNGTTTNFNAAGIDQRFATAAAMDAAFPPGTYTLTVGSRSPVNLVMPVNPYPADVPRVIGGTWNAAGRLVVDPTKDYIIDQYIFRFQSAVRIRLSLYEPLVRRRR